MQKFEMEGETMMLEMAEEGEPFSERGLLGLGIGCHGTFSVIQSLVFSHTDPEIDLEQWITQHITDF